MEKMRVAVLGCGSIGRRHLRNLRTLGQFDLLVFDPVAEARQAVEKESGVHAFGSLDDVWQQKPNAALITAPSNLHIPLALEAVRHGCDIFVEKPLAHSLDGTEALSNEVERRGLISMVGCNMRFHPGPAVIKTLIEQKAAGEIIAARIQAGSFLPRWRPQQDFRRSYSASTEWGGAILDCIHEIDLGLWYFGPAKLVASARLSAGTLGLETDGLAEIILRHESGVLSSIHLNFVQRDYRRGCQVIGTQGTLYWDFVDRCANVFGENGSLSQSIPEPSGWDVNQMYLDEMRHFIQAVKTRSATINPLAGGAAALTIALAARSQ